MAAGVRVETGASLRLGALGEHLHLFDTETGARIGP
jgi:hypothetical protein